MPDRDLERVLVTGALGFIGGAITARLRSEGVQVSGVDARADPALEVVAGDVSVPGSWQEHAAGCRRRDPHRGDRVASALGP